MELFPLYFYFNDNKHPVRSRTLRKQEAIDSVQRSVDDSL